ncbi:RHS repeat-associated core domain-containing protein [Dictyobacter kobayashii]|uniref:RHS repeat-associated core domain-containing protein n=1 Tax=Dictyobacter kobayashii TaxID=2014872 RepID=UPI00138719C2|nr:RHS repeat-associated core domain-containing protein [Dictyobacter kobayashii]
MSPITGGTTSTTKYYSAGGQKVAMRQDGTFSYLMPDFLGSNSIALRADGSVQAVQLFSPFGATRYSDGTMLSPFNFTGQRLDTQTGLLYYNARYYDANSGRFTSADTVETNGSGLDPFAYVKGNPETFADPTGHGRCNTDGDCTYGSGPPPPPSDPSPPPGVSGVDDACHNMALCGPGSNGGLSGTNGNSQPTTGGGTQCHGGCNIVTTDHTVKSSPTPTTPSSSVKDLTGLLIGAGKIAAGIGIVITAFLNFTKSCNGSVRSYCSICSKKCYYGSCMAD